MTQPIHLVALDMAGTTVADDGAVEEAFQVALDAVELTAGEHFRVDLEREAGDARRAPLPHPEIFEAVQPGTELLLDDGKVRQALTETVTRRLDAIPAGPPAGRLLARYTEAQAHRPIIDLIARTAGWTRQDHGAR